MKREHHHHHSERVGNELLVMAGILIPRFLLQLSVHCCYYLWLLLILLESSKKVGDDDGCYKLVGIVLLAGFTSTDNQKLAMRDVPLLFHLMDRIIKKKRGRQRLPRQVLEVSLYLAFEHAIGRNLFQQQLFAVTGKLGTS